MLLPSSCPSRIRQLRQLCKQICQLAFANTSRSPSQRVTNDEDAVCSSQPGGVGERKPKGKRILQEKDRQMYALAREGAQLPLIVLANGRQSSWRVKKNDKRVE